MVCALSRSRSPWQPVAGVRPGDVAAWAAHKAVDSQAADQAVSTGAAEEQVVSAEPEEPVVPRLAVELVCLRRPAQGVVSIGPDDRRRGRRPGRDERTGGNERQEASTGHPRLTVRDSDVMSRRIRLLSQGPAGRRELTPGPRS